MKNMDQLYFSDIDDTNCQQLKYFISDAKIEGLKDITLLKAEKDTEGDYIWCIQYGEAICKSECKKSYCSDYESKSGRGVCLNRGTLYHHGEEENFKITQQ